MAKFFETVPVDQVLRMGIDTPESAVKGVSPSGQLGRGTNLRRAILVVDDEHVIADTLVAILNASGYAAVAAYDGDSALRLASARVPDLLLTDISMPGMNGIALATAVRERFPTCKVLLFSGHAGSTNLIEEARSQGQDFELLSKPIHPRDLLERLNSLV